MLKKLLLLYIVCSVDPTLSTCRVMSTGVCTQLFLFLTPDGPGEKVLGMVYKDENSPTTPTINLRPSITCQRQQQPLPC